MAVLDLQKLEIGYAGRAFLPPIQLSVQPGELWAIVGPNGGGKSTLLKTALGLLPAIRGRAILGSSSPVGYVPQRSMIEGAIPARVKDIVAAGVDRGWSFLIPGFGWTRRADVANALKKTKLTELRNHQFGQLSEGQKQRALMAKALVNDPALLILDEPTSAMDINSERLVFELISSLRSEHNVAVMVVSHHLSVVGTQASHLLLLDKDHKLVVSGPIDEAAVDPRVTDIYGFQLRDACEHNGHQH